MSLSKSAFGLPWGILNLKRMRTTSLRNVRSKSFGDVFYWTNYIMGGGRREKGNVRQAFRQPLGLPREKTTIINLHIK